MAWESGTFFPALPLLLSLSFSLFLSLSLSCSLSPSLLLPFVSSTPSYPFSHSHFPYHPSFVSRYSLCHKPPHFLSRLSFSIYVSRCLVFFLLHTDTHITLCVCVCVCVCFMLLCSPQPPFKNSFSSISSLFVFHSLCHGQTSSTNTRFIQIFVNTAILKKCLI